ncbi:MAG TPA: putative sulfate exporter family transporter, partial [Pilimelia sp.]|nr:putative sulfate exporter family transporter [Pilimelia sp.]
ICGASAIAAMEDNAEADGDDVAASIAMVTLCGAFAMTAIPLLQAPLGLSDAQLGAWAGAAVHEVGQVVAAASPAGAAAVGVAVVVKLTRVLLLAPLVAGVSLARRRGLRQTRGGRATPPLVPLFVLGFLACVALRSTGWVPAPVLAAIAWVQTGTLAAALFGLGTSVHLPSLARTGGPVLVLGVVSTAVIGAVSLAGVLVLG